MQLEHDTQIQSWRKSKLLFKTCLHRPKTHLLHRKFEPKIQIGQHLIFLTPADICCRYSDACSALLFSSWLRFAAHREDWWIWVGECVNEQEYSGSAECSTRILNAAQNICTDSSWKASLFYDKCECWVNSIHWILSAWASIRKTMNVCWWKSEATFILGLTKKVNWSLRALWVLTSRILAGGLSDSWFCPLCPSGAQVVWK